MHTLIPEFPTNLISFILARPKGIPLDVHTSTQGDRHAHTQIDKRWARGVFYLISQKVGEVPNVDRMG